MNDIPYIFLFALTLCVPIYTSQFQACHGLHYKPNTVSSSPTREVQKQEARDDLVIGGGADLIGKHENVHVPELHETQTILNSFPPTSKVSTSAKLALSCFATFYKIN